MIRLKNILNEAQIHAQTQRESLKMLWQLKINHKSEKDIVKLIDQLEKKIKSYEPK